MEEAQGDDRESGARDTSRSTPRRSFASKHDLQQTYIRKAKLKAKQAAPPRAFPMFASCHRMGGTFGVGVGLYFKVLYWFQIVFFVLALLSVPYFIVINFSVFTDEEHKYNYNFGTKVYETTSLFSFTFAAIVDASTDNDTLQYMHTEIAGVWNGPMTKGTFLVWLSLLDAGGVVLLLAFLTFMTLMAPKFVYSVDETTTEVNDFTVLVQGLPDDVSATEVGDFFCQFGEVMDVVLVRDMRPVLSACARASHLEQKRRLMTDQLRMYKSALYAKRADEAEAKLEKLMHKMENLAHGGGPSDFPVKAAFVTFNHESEHEICLESMPHGWWSALLIPRAMRLRSRHSLFVRPAYAPEDYMHENIPCSWFARTSRRTMTRLIVLAILLITAAIITVLETVNKREARNIYWQGDGLSRAIGDAATTGLVIDASLGTNPNSTYSQNLNTTQQLSTAFSATGYNAWAAGTGGAPAWGDYCVLSLDVCTAYYDARISSASFSIPWGEQIVWLNQTERLLKQRVLMAALEGCTGGTDSDCLEQNLALQGCTACYCMGLSMLDLDNRTTSWITATKTQCSTYIDSWDLKSWGLRISVAVVIAVVNFALKFVIEFLVQFEKHWTHTEEEQAFAFMVYLAQLLNSALVLLLVNASPAADATRAETQGSLRFLTLDGQHDDFTPAWYKDVGLSIMVLVMLNVASPLTLTLAECGWKWAQRFWLVRCTENAYQPAYDEVYSRPEYQLSHRVTSVMLVFTAALVFGSGMPILYLFALVVFLSHNLVERIVIKRVFKLAARYSDELPSMIIAVMPWAVLVHCLFGIWMHSHFKVYGDTSTTSILSARLSTGLSSSGNSTDTKQGLTTSVILERISQPNSIALLVCAALSLLWIIFRVLLWRVVRPLVRAFISRCCCDWCVRMVDPPEPGAMSYEAGLAANELTGVVTYRLPHHPRYSHIFNGNLHRKIWVRAQGDALYTRVLSLHGRRAANATAAGQAAFLVARNVLRDVGSAELELTLAVKAARQAGRLGPASSMLSQSSDGSVKNKTLPQLSQDLAAKGRDGHLVISVPSPKRHNDITPVSSPRHPVTGGSRFPAIAGGAVAATQSHSTPGTGGAGTYPEIYVPSGPSSAIVPDDVHLLGNDTEGGMSPDEGTHPFEPSRSQELDDEIQAPPPQAMTWAEEEEGGHGAADGPHNVAQRVARALGREPGMSVAAQLTQQEAELAGARSPARLLGPSGGAALPAASGSGTPTKHAAPR